MGIHAKPEQVMIRKFVFAAAATVALGAATLSVTSAPARPVVSSIITTTITATGMAVSASTGRWGWSATAAAT
jgi:hypothetical protein